MAYIPRIKIKHGRFLEPIFTRYVTSDPRWSEVVVPSTEEVQERIQEYRSTWNTVHTLLLTSVCNTLDLTFDPGDISVYVVALNPRPFSDPIVLKSGYTQHEFVSVLTHELIHRLFSMNIRRVHATIFSDMFPDESPRTQNHVVVHAVLTHLFHDVLKNDAILDTNIERSKKHTTNEYVRAWDIVSDKGYMNIITEFKARYLA
jgi:hypothetical protein